MKTQGRVGAEWGFKNPVEGWFNVVITDDIDIITSEKSGKSSLKIPTKVIDGDFSGANISIFALIDTDFGEQKIADVIANVGLLEEFNKKFPGDISVFDATVIKGLHAKLPGKYLCIKLEKYVKDGKEYGNMVQLDKYGSTAGAEKATPPKQENVEDGW